MACIPDKDLNSLILTADTHFLENIQGSSISNSQRGNGLGNARAIGGDGFDFSVKIDFEGQSCSVKNSPAVLAVAEVALNVASDFGSQSAFQILAD
jgi:hypothetical protein